MQQQLIRAANGVLFIHADPDLRESFVSRIGKKASAIALCDWRQSEEVIDFASRSDAQLVLFSGGPAGKYIGPKIAAGGKVVLDLGSAASEW
jgi:hypothetical protein